MKCFHTLSVWRRGGCHLTSLSRTNTPLPCSSRTIRRRAPAACQRRTSLRGEKHELKTAPQQITPSLGTAAGDSPEQNQQHVKLIPPELAPKSLEEGILPFQKKWASRWFGFGIAKPSQEQCHQQHTSWNLFVGVLFFWEGSFGCFFFFLNPCVQFCSCTVLQIPPHLLTRTFIQSWPSEALVVLTKLRPSTCITANVIMAQHHSYL